VLKKYGFKGKFSQFVEGKKHEGRFKEAGERLFTTYNIMCHALSIQRSADSVDHDRQQLEMLKQAFESDARLRHAELESAIQTLAHSAAPPAALLCEIGVSSGDLPETLVNLQLVAQDLSLASTAPSSAFSASTSGAAVTLADLQRCSWRIRGELLTIEQKEGKKGKKMDVTLGDGTFGVVYAATYCGERVVVKKMKNPQNADAAHTVTGSQALESFSCEVSLACALNHPNIVHTLGGVVDEEEEPPCWIVMERMDQSLAKVSPHNLLNSRSTQLRTRVAYYSPKSSPGAPFRH
jgi:hypothetical protein